MSQDSKCIIKDCLRPAAASLGNGLCLICHARAKSMVAAGKTTWEELESLGLVLPKGGDSFSKAFNEAKPSHTAQEGK